MSELKKPVVLTIQYGTQRTYIEKLIDEKTYQVLLADNYYNLGLETPNTKELEQFDV